MVCTASMVLLGALVTIETAASPIFRSRALNATKFGVSWPPSSDRMISPAYIGPAGEKGGRVLNCCRT